MTNYFLIFMAVLLFGCSKENLETPNETHIDKDQVILEFAIELEKEEINYKHQFEKDELKKAP